MRRLAITDKNSNKYEDKRFKKAEKTSYYRWQKLRLEALLAVVQRKEEFINIIRKTQDIEGAQRVAGHSLRPALQLFYSYVFNLVFYLMNSLQES